MVTAQSDITDGAPRWLWTLVLAGVAALINLSLIGVVLAMAGQYRTSVALPVAILATAALTPLLRRLIRAESDASTSGQWCAVAAAATVVCLGAWSASHSSHHVVTYHDPGVYASTAALLAADGSLRTSVGDPADEPLVAAALARFDDAVPTGPGAYESGAEHLEYQFSHSPSVVMAAASDVAGRRGLFASPTAAGVLALLATYLLITRFVRSAPFAAAATISLGLTTPFLYVTRGTYSEPFALAVISTGLALLATRAPIGALRAAAVGLCIGSSVLFRIDGQLAVVALVGVGAVAALTGTSGRSLLSGAAGAAVPTAIGIADLVSFSGDYWTDQQSFDAMLRLAAVVGVVGVTLVFVWRGHRLAAALRERWLPSAAAACAVIVSAVFAVLWLVRPRVQTARAEWGPDDRYAHRVEGLQAAMGLDADGTRSYAELTVAAIGWYIGPIAMALAVGGVGVLVHRAMRRIDGPVAPVVAFWIITVPPFLLDWRITPYQPWASRRFIPIIIPAILIFAAVGGDVLVRRLRRRIAAHDLPNLEWLPGAAIGVLCLALVVPAAIAMAPVRNLAEQRGFLGGLDQGCSAIGSATVLSLGTLQYNVPLRAWCDVPAVALPGVEATSVEWFVDEARRTCEPAAVLVPDPIHLWVLDDAASQGLVDDPVIVDLTNPWFPEESLERPPEEYAPERLNYAVAAVRLPEGCGRPT